jgi:Putative zinc-finger
MTGLTDCGDIRYALGVYVVGAIDPAERAAVDAHLRDCRDCREELAGLAGLPALLGRVPVADAERLALGDEQLEEAPAELLDALLRQVAARRRARRWRVITAAAAAAVIAIGGGITGGILMGRSHGTQIAASHLARGSDPATHVSAAVYYRSTASGTAMQVEQVGIPYGTQCDFWVTTTSGRHVLAAQWTVRPGQNGYYWYNAWTSTPMAKLRATDISTTSGKVLVTIPASLPARQRHGAGRRRGVAVGHVAGAGNAAVHAGA